MFNKLYEYIKNIILLNYKFIIFLIVLILLFYIELPYVIYNGGGMVNLCDRVENIYDKEYSGNFNMTYVSAVKPNILYTGLSLILPGWDLEKSNMDTSTINDIGKMYLNEGIINAKIAAYERANVPYDIVNYYVTVTLVSEDADTSLKIGDRIVSVNDIEIDNTEKLKSTIEKYNGEKINIKVIDNNNVNKNRYGYVKDNKLGIYIHDTYDFKSDNDIDIYMKKSEYGSSGTLMMSLTIYNYLIEEDILKGRIIAGTGTLDKDGNVGEIDGVKYKVIGASKKGASIFFVPRGNYKDALKTKKDNNLDIDIVLVDNIDNAIEYLKK